MSFAVITRGKPDEVERHLDIAAAAPDWQRDELIRALVNALPRAQRENAFHRRTWSKCAGSFRFRSASSSC